jgi:hypothetical protein
MVSVLRQWARKPPTYCNKFGERYVKHSFAKPGDVLWKSGQPSLSTQNTPRVSCFWPSYGVTVSVAVVCADALPLDAVTVIGKVPTGVPSSSRSNEASGIVLTLLSAGSGHETSDRLLDAATQGTQNQQS